MSDSKERISVMDVLANADVADNDRVPILDVSDDTDAPEGTGKALKIKPYTEYAISQATIDGGSF